MLTFDSNLQNESIKSYILGIPIWNTRSWSKEIVTYFFHVDLLIFIRFILGVNKRLGCHETF